jgi:hypothetical protein
MAVHPEALTPQERLNEIAAFLALGLMRLVARKSSEISAEAGDSSLDCPATRSGHANELDCGDGR